MRLGGGGGERRLRSLTLLAIFVLGRGKGVGSSQRRAHGRREGRRKGGRWRNAHLVLASWKSSAEGGRGKLRHRIKSPVT